MPDDAERLLDDPEAAAYLNTTTRHMQTLVRERGLPMIKLGGKRRFRLEDLDAWIKQQREQRVS